MSAEHSKLPFAMEYDNDVGANDEGYREWYNVNAPDGERIARVDDQRDAQYIVKACNAFPALVSALKLAREALYLHTGPDEPGDMPDPLQETIVDALRAAGEEV